MTKRIASLLWLVCFVVVADVAADKKGDVLKLTLPPTFYAVPGVEMNIYYDNIVLTEKPEDYRFIVKCKIGKCEERRWTVTPRRKDRGDYPVSITVKDAKGKTLAKGKTTLHVAKAGAGAGKTLRLLIVGDSLTNANMYPKEIGRLLSEPGNPQWVMFGTNRRGGPKEKVGHEGYGGWTWKRFASHYEPNPDKAKRKFSSPFVFVKKGGEPKLDVPEYFKEHCGGKRPDIVTFLLGINDCFSAKPDDQAAIDERVDQMFTQAETLISAFRKAAPKADLGICLTTPPNSRESGFEANYKGRYHRWGWKRIQHRLVQRQLDHFGGREAKRIFIVPTELNVDPVDGYSDNNGVHPNAFGYKQIGASIYCWIKWRMEER
ncbi:MAG: SGNH/GDSL hydrolase family protein [Planctomycetes bacterium]|nr:SGNH/GDSL hydrolase family protein [Planctomycetota bacterium]